MSLMLCRKTIYTEHFPPAVKMCTFYEYRRLTDFVTHLFKKIMQDKQNPPVSSAPELQHEVAELMVEALNLEVSADQITADAPLYGEGLGLDSIDVLEVALVVSKRYGVQLRADSADNQHIFSSLRSLSDYIATQRTR